MSGGRTVPSSPWVALGVVLTGTSIGSFNNSVASVALPHVLGSFQEVSVSEGTWLLTLYIFSTAAMMPFAGRMLDFWGIRRIYGASFVLYAGGSLLCAVAPTFHLLIAGRVVQGIAAGAVLPTVFTTVRMAFPAEKRGRALGIWAAVNGASLSAGPVVGGLLIGAFGWRSIFWLDVPIALAAAAAMWRWVPNFGGLARGSFDLVGGLLMIMTLSAAMVVLGQADGWGLSHPMLWTMVGVTIALGTSFVFITARTPEPFFDVTLFQEKLYALVTGIAALQMVALFGVLFAVPLMLEGSFGASARISGLLLSLTPMTAMITAPMAGRLVDRIGLRIPLATGSALLFFGGVFLMGAADASYVWVAGSLALVGLGIGLIQSPSATGVTYAVDPERAGVALGAFNTARFMSGVAGTSLFALLFEAVARVGSTHIADYPPASLTSGFRAVFCGIAIAGAIAFVLGMRIPRVRDRGAGDGDAVPEGLL